MYNMNIDHLKRTSDPDMIIVYRMTEKMKNLSQVKHNTLYTFNFTSTYIFKPLYFIVCSLLAKLASDKLFLP